VLTTAACTDTPEVSTTVAELVTLSIGTERIIGVAVSDDGSIIIGTGGDPGSGSRVVLALLREDSGDLEPLSLPERDTCNVTDYLWPQRLADGRVAAVRQHRSDCGADEIVAIDVNTLDVEVLVEVSEPVRAYAVAPGQEDAVITIGSNLCAGLGSVRAGERADALPMDVFGTGGGSFSMVDAWDSASGEACESTGWAAWPSINADGELAFFATADVVGTSGPDRAMAPAELYITDAAASEANPAGPTVVEPRALVWSPDGRMVAFSGNIDGADGTWIWGTGDANPMPVYDRAAKWLAWNPDGRGLVLVTAVDREDPLSDAMIVRVTWQP
jgi:hypothetical protein